MFTLLFDLTQLILLLFFTGGLNNPFALLILAPVTISATTLRLQSTLVLAICAIIFVTIVTRFHLPLMGFDGTVYELPLLFTLGFWNALIIGIIFLASYARRVSVEAHSMNQALLAGLASAPSIYSCLPVQGACLVQKREAELQPVNLICRPDFWTELV